MKGLRLASKKAEDSSFDRARIGAVLVKGGRVLASANNELRFTRKAAATWESTHAEEMVILNVLRQPGGLQKLHGSTLYISRVKKDGELGLAKPCANCQRLIDSVHIKKVVHS